MVRRVIVAVVCTVALALLTAGAGIAEQLSPAKRGTPAQRPAGAASTARKAIKVGRHPQVIAIKP
jgi:hypothetical protein